MDEPAWMELLAALETVGELHPVKAKELDAYESRSGFKLPASYRHFCRVFGPGRIDDWFAIAVPRFSGKSPNKYDLEAVRRFYHEGREWQEYSDAPQQFERAIIVGSDDTGALFIWDPAEQTDKRRGECAVYAVWRDWSRERVCATFWEFANICLHRGDRTLYDTPPQVGFLAVWHGGRTVKMKPKAEPDAAADGGRDTGSSRHKGSRRGRRC